LLLVLAGGGQLCGSVGEGWRAAKVFRAGSRFHAVAGVVTVAGVAESDAAEEMAEWGYGVLVADFHTFFVGQQRVLVHDDFPRKPTSALLPGMGQPGGV
jgi:hypothetical protein